MAIEGVEAVIGELGIDPSSARVECEGSETRFALRRGSALVLVAIHPPAGRDAEGTLRIMAPVVASGGAEDRLAMYEHLLRLNATGLRGLAFGLLDDEIVLVIERGLLDLDASEIRAALGAIGEAADHYDDELADRFGTERASDRDR